MGKKLERLANRLAAIYSKDRYQGAKNIGNLVASLKRTVSSIAAITNRKFFAGEEMADLLSSEDRAVLDKASAILNHLAGEAEVAKRTVKRTETEYKARYERLLREAKTELTKAMAPTSIEDMVVIILWGKSYMARNLQDALAKSESQRPGEWTMQRALEYYVQSARDDLVGSVAVDAASKNVPLADVLTPLLARLTEHRPKILEREAVLIAKIKNRIEPESATASAEK